MVVANVFNAGDLDKDKVDENKFYTRKTVFYSI